MVQKNSKSNILSRNRILLVSIATGLLFAVIVFNVWTTIKGRFDDSIAHQITLTADHISHIISDFQGVGIPQSDLKKMLDVELEPYNDLYVEIKNSDGFILYQSGDKAESLDDHQIRLTLDPEIAGNQQWVVNIRTTSEFLDNTNYGFIYIGLFIAMFMSCLLGVTVYFVQKTRENAKSLREINEQLALAWEKAEQASLSKTKFLANMSHEIRTPMNVVLGFISVLKSEEISKKHREYLNLMEVSSKNLLSIVNDILEIEKLESGEIQLTKVSFNPLAELHKLLKMQEVFFDEKGLYLKTEFTGKTNIWVEGDVNKFHQIFTNLIRNAFKFTDQGGLTVRADVVAQNDFAVFTIRISDTGIGIPKDKLIEIFERFNQVDSSPNRKYEGTGLGLAITQKLVEAMGGEIKVESEVGVGTSFEVLFRFRTISIPDNTIDEDEFSNVPESAVKFKNSRVLVVDDHYVNILVIQKTLEYFGIKTDYAENAKNGVQKAEKHPYNLIFMDVHMPDIDGYEAAKILKDNGVDVPVVALSADVTTDAKRKAFEHGMQDYLTKPFSRDKLLIILKKYLMQEVSD